MRATGGRRSFRRFYRGADAAPTVAIAYIACQHVTPLREFFMQIHFAALGATPLPGSALVVLGLDKGALTPAATALDVALDGRLSRAMASARYTGAKGQTLDLITGASDDAARILLVGTGAAGDITPALAELAAATAWRALASTGLETLVVRLGDVSADVAAQAAFGLRLAAYRFDRYRTKEKPEAKPSVTKVVIETATPDAAAAADATLATLADSIIFARDLVSEPANILHPVEFASRAKALEAHGLKVEILGEAEMKALGMGALLGVGQGSRRESQLAASEATGEGLWRLPMPASYEKQIDSLAADMKNVGGRPGGSITAALFLQRFIKDTPWAHLDIASTAWRKSGAQATHPEGASGFGVRLLNQLVADGFED
eukprot:gene14227-14347_t